MKKTWYLITILLGIFIAVAPGLADISCTMTASCSNTTILRVTNDSGGWHNAHAQLTSWGGTAYPNLLCCQSSNQVLGTSCSGTYTNFLRLSNDTNAHVQDAFNASLPVIYPNMSCISSTRAIVCGLNLTSCSANYNCVGSIASSEGNNFTNAHISNCSYYALKVCCKTNSPPAAPVATYPNYTTTITDRYTVFNWTNVTDPDGDPVYYQINVTAPSGLGCFGFSSANVGAINISSLTELCTDLDHASGSFSFMVRACDASGCSAFSNNATFNVTSVNSITLNLSNVTFGAMAAGEDKNTTTNSPQPIVVQNNGNIRINISSYANNSLFSTRPGLNDTSFQFMAGVNQSSAFNTTRSTMGFINVTNISQNLITTLLYLNNTNMAEIEFRVVVPLIEPIGPKAVAIVVTSTPEQPS